MSEGKDKEIEKLKTELKRSLSVVEVKEAHKKIEEVEKSRKKATILSIIERLNFSLKLNYALLKGIDDAKKTIPEELLDKRVPNLGSPEMDNFVKAFDSLRYDFQKNIDIKNEDFDRLFPRPTLSFDSMNEIGASLCFICYQMEDMKAYCKRLV